MASAVVLADFEAEFEEELSVSKGTIVTVLEFGEDDWADIILGDRQGIVPNSYLQLCDPEESEEIEHPRINNADFNVQNPAIDVTKQQQQQPQQQQPIQITKTIEPRPLPTPIPATGTPTPTNGTGAVGRGGSYRGESTNSLRGKPRGGSVRGVSPNGARGAPVRGNPRGRPGSPNSTPNPRGAPRGGPNPRGAPAQRGGSRPLPSPGGAQQNGKPTTSSAQPNGTQSPAAKSIEENDHDSESTAKHRMNVINELLHTEKDYVKDLEIVTKVFARPLLQQSIISEEEAAALFSNLEVLVTVNQQLHALLLANEKEDLMIGQIFIQMADFFKMYTGYCANQPKSLATLDKLQTGPAFAAFLQQCMENEECRGLTLFSFLIKPIQRICKYPLLLKDLKNHTPTSHPDFENLEIALQKIEGVVAYVNDRKRLAENLQKILDVQDQIESTEALNLVEPSRRFVREGNITVIEKGRTRHRKTFVFNDLIVLTKEHKTMMGNIGKDRFKAKFHLNEIVIVNVADTDVVKCACEVRPKDEQKQKFSFVFIFNSQKEKDDWVGEIKTLIREFQKKAVQEAKVIQAKKAEAEALGIPYEPELSLVQEEEREKEREKEKAKEKEKERREAKNKAGASKRSPATAPLRPTISKSKMNSVKLSPINVPQNQGGTAAYSRPPPPKGRNLTTRVAPASPKSTSSLNVFKKPKIFRAASSSSKMIVTEKDKK